MYTKIFTEIDSLPTQWDECGSNVFLKTSYLRAQHNAKPANFSLIYIGFFEKEVLVGKTCAQFIRLKGENLFRSPASGIKKWLRNRLNFNLLNFGNIKLTGKHIFDLNNGEIEPKLYAQSVKIIPKIEQTIGAKAHLILFKDYPLSKKAKYKSYLQDFVPVEIQPNMVFYHRENWSSFLDYLSDLKKKYRTRVRRAIKKLGEVSFKEIHVEELVKENKVIYKMYQNVALNAKINPYHLPENFFIEMKKNLSHDFKIFVGYNNGKPVCFYTIIINQNKLESGFLGFDTHLQKEHQLYLNMLYKMVQYTIDNKYKTISFSRTALEIKSSVGAVPEPMIGMIKGRNKWINYIFNYFFSQLNPTEKWVERSVFK